ncbi:MAG: ATP-binding protein [Actinomycetota bacterium]
MTTDAYVRDTPPHIKDALAQIQRRYAERGGEWAKLTEAERDVKRKEYDAQRKAEHLLMRRDEIERRLRIVPEDFKGARISVKPVRDWTDAFIADPYNDGPWGLLLVGETGVGKSFNAWGAMKAVIESGYDRRIGYRSAPTLMIELRTGEREAVRETTELLQSCGLLFLDDLGVDRGTEFLESALHSILDPRSSCRRKTIIATNVPPSGWSNRFGDRIGSRLKACVQVVMDGPDQRPAQGRVVHVQMDDSQRQSPPPQRWGKGVMPPSYYEKGP